MTPEDDPFYYYPFDEDLGWFVTVVGYVEPPAHSLPALAKNLHEVIVRHMGVSPGSLTAIAGLPSESNQIKAVAGAAGWREDESIRVGRKPWRFEYYQPFNEWPAALDVPWMDPADYASLQIPYGRSAWLWVERRLRGASPLGMVLMHFRAGDLAESGRECRRRLIRDCVGQLDAIEHTSYALIDLCGPEEAASSEVYLEDRWSSPLSWPRFVDKVLWQQEPLSRSPRNIYWGNYFGSKSAIGRQAASLSKEFNGFRASHAGFEGRSEVLPHGGLLIELSGDVLDALPRVVPDELASFEVGIPWLNRLLRRSREGSGGE